MMEQGVCLFSILVLFVVCVFLWEWSCLYNCYLFGAFDSISSISNVDGGFAWQDAFAFGVASPMFLIWHLLAEPRTAFLHVYCVHKTTVILPSRYF